MEKMSGGPEVLLRCLRGPPPDYSRWTIEELRQFAFQLRVRDARKKNRRELLELFKIAH
jgi:hypothetical protein